MSFDGLKYTRESLAEELALVERHATDGSAFQAGCSCIQEKHLLMIQGLAREGKTLATNEEEKEFYDLLGEAARELRKTIVDADFKWPDNPLPRKFLPHGLTEQEKGSVKLQHTLSRCIKKVEDKCCKGHSTILYHDGAADYSQCSCNPVAVCRASVKTNPHPRFSKEEFSKQMELLRETAETKHPTVKYPPYETGARELH
jgi:hypothetical protein